MLSTTHNFLFIHVPKTGGNSIQKVLLPYSDDQMALAAPFHDGVDRFEILSPGLNIHKHSTLADYQAQLGCALFSRLIKIACVRNPWDRCVSFFFSPHRGEVLWDPEAFAEFIQTTVKPHRDFLSLPDSQSDCFGNLDVILRFEQLQDDFDSLCDRLGIERNELPHANVSNRECYRVYYQQAGLTDLVRFQFAEEIERFGYAF